MRSNYLKTLKTAVLAVTVLLLGASVCFAQQQVNLTAGASSITLPDGSIVPMWGYSCGTLVAGSTASCAKLNPTAPGWSPIVITIPTGATDGLQINLTNNLQFGTGGVNKIPTSLTIVGLLGGGLGTPGGSSASPDHSSAQAAATWPASGPADVPGEPPAQAARVRSFGAEVGGGATLPLTWSAANLRPGTYLIESGSHPSIQGPMGLFGMLVVTTAPAGAIPGTAYGTAPTAVTYNSEVPLLFSEIDPIQNRAVDAAVGTTGFTEEEVWSGQPGACGHPASPHTCYPPAVNYSPLYYLINGAAFDKTNAGASLFPAVPAPPATGTVLVRLVNAGLRMHVPSIVGSLTGGSSVPGFQLIAEDGNQLPGTPRVQSEVFMAAGKTYDVMINPPAAGGTALPIFDRQLSLSANATSRDAGMLAYISVNGSTFPGAAGLGAAQASPDVYNSVIADKTFTVSDPSKGVIANDINVYGVAVTVAPTKGTVTLNANGTFMYVPSAGWTAPDQFTYQANGAAGPTAVVSLGEAPAELPGNITVGDDTFASKVATTLSVKLPGVLANDTDGSGYPLSVNAVAAGGSLSACPAGVTSNCVALNPDGSFNAYAAPGNADFYYNVKSSRGTLSANAHVQLTFPTRSGLVVNLVDGKTKADAGSDYRWIIEEDKTFYIDPNNTTTSATSVPLTFGTNFHTSYMPVVAQGCTGPLSCEDGQTLLGAKAVCDGGNGVCTTDRTSKTIVLPGDVALDPGKRYYISILPGDAPDGGYAMGGAQIPAACTIPPNAITCSGTFAPVNVIVEKMDLPTAQVSVFVFEDDFPLNGEHDAGGGIDLLSPNEPGLGSFNITLFDDVGGTGDAAGQMTYDMFNMPLSNSLAGTMDPVTGMDACPVSKGSRTVVATPSNPDGGHSDTGVTGMITVCPKYESDGVTLSPLGGQAVIANLPPGRYGVVATPGADRIARGEQWLQTNTLDGGPAHDAFVKVEEPSYFQEFGPAGYHVTIGFANPQIITSRKAATCADRSTDPTRRCTAGLTGKVTGVHMSRTPDERLYSTGTRDTFSYTRCFVSLGSPDGADFDFARCNEDGTFSFTGIPNGDWKITVFDQWNDQIVDGISTPVRLSLGSTLNLGDVAVHAWKQNLYTRTFFDQNFDGLSNADNNGNPTEPGLSLVPTNIRFRDGSFSNFNSTDLAGFAGFNEIFPLFNWYVLETDSNRYKTTGIHVVNDAGGPVDGSPSCGQPGFPACGDSAIAGSMARTVEDQVLPDALRFPGSVYCADADCTGASIASGPINGGSSGPGGSTGRIDPPSVSAYGWQGFAGQNQFVEFGKKPFAVGENGGIRGHVIYASTRPFDDPALLLQLSWEPGVPHVKINLYQEVEAPDKSTGLVLVDRTETSSFDDWAQGYRSDNVRNMNCPGQGTSDPFYFSLADQPNYLDVYNHVHDGTALHPNGDHSQYKCYDGMHNWAQLQPAPYDGMYQFPSVIGYNPTTGKPTGTNCTICTGANANPTVATGDPTAANYDPYRAGQPMLPPGKYVVEVIVPDGYELVKEEDKNILLGDSYIAPVPQQFGGLGNIFIMPDQASLSAYNANNPLNPTTDLGASPRHEGDTGSVEAFWPCVGQKRIVPDWNSLFPNSGQNSAFAGAERPLCDRKEVTLEDQMTVLAKFYVFTSAHVAGHYTGIITDDFTSEFDPFSPHFGEKFSPAFLPVSVKDWAGNEVSRTYSDMWGIYDGLNFSSFGVNPPDPSGYVPAMMVMCMNDRGSAVAPDPLYQESYSQFCYELPFMPGQTGYFDTPVIPTTAFAEGYNHPDCEYPDATPAIASVLGDSSFGPWVSASGHTLTINALGPQQVNNYGYSGPNAPAPPFNQKKVLRNYGFGTSQGTGFVTIGGVNAPVVTWSDSQITVTVPAGVPSCRVQKRGLATPEQCGQLVITSGNGKQSIDTVTVTVGATPPTVVTASQACAGHCIQDAIDNAHPGDLIIVQPGTYSELLVMWKPVRLQGVGAASVIINADPHPAGRLTPWRQRMVCLFGLGLDGVPNTWDASCGGNFGMTSAGGFNPTSGNPQIDRLPLEATVGWDTTLNGNLAEQLQEPTLLGAYEGAGITVLAKGVDFRGGDPWSDGAEIGGFPASTVLLGTSTRDCAFASNFMCNPSRIDGLTISNSSQGGGGIFAHGWTHNLEISNNRVRNNQGTLTGGITIGQGEHPPSYLVGGVNAAPGSCQSEAGLPANTQLPYCFDRFVNVHNNSVTVNSSEGDELFSATPSGGGGVTFCTGADFYSFNNNWVCGNMSTGNGGGFAHLGYIWLNQSDAAHPNQGIRHNVFMFNESTNPTVPTEGGGLVLMGAPDTDPTCPGIPDADCATRFGGASDGTGPGMVIDANLILGNAASSGAGGGLRIQGLNGTDVGFFPTNQSRWNLALVSNNIIANNVAGWDGAGVSLQDSLNVNFINNTVMSNDSTASSGVLFDAFFAPLAGSPGQTCNGSCDRAAPQPSGLSVAPHSTEMLGQITGSTTCAATHPFCKTVSDPLISNDVFWQNRTFHIGVSAGGAGQLQNTVALLNSFTNTSIASQATIGACVSGTNAWDIGVRGDTAPGNHASGATLAPRYSILTNASENGNGTNNGTGASANPNVAKLYCNGSRIPPDIGPGFHGYQVPPGTNESNVPVPPFTLLAGATVDEGNNWINITWGPLSLINPSAADQSSPTAVLGDYKLTSPSPAINAIPPGAANNAYTLAPSTDFFGNNRKTAGDPNVDRGAVEFGATSGGGGGGGSNPPALTVLDNFNRSNAANLGVNWNATGIGIAGNVAFSLLTGNGYWAGTGNPFGNSQGAAFTFAGVPINNTGLVLKATGGTLTAPANYVRVRFQTGGSVTIATVTSGTATTVATLTGFGGFANGDTLTATVDATGAVRVWRTRAGTSTLLTSSPVSTSFTGGGRIGMQLGLISAVDNFAGGNVP